MSIVKKIYVSIYAVTLLCMHVMNASIDISSPLQTIEGKLNSQAQSTGFIPMSELMPFLEQIPMPNEISAFLDQVKISNPVLKASTTEFKLAGLAMINDLQVSIDLLIKKATGMPQVYCEILLPGGAKPSDLSASLKKLDLIEFNSTGFIISNYAYKDKASQIDIRPGVTFKAEVSFDALLGKIRQKIGGHLSADLFKSSLSQFLVTKKLGIMVSGHIPMMLDDITLKMELPLEMGFNFEALRKANGSPVFEKPLIKKITLSRIFVELGLKQAEPEITLALGIQVHPIGQQQPLEFQALGKVTQSGIEIAGAMFGALNPAFGLNWLALGQLAKEQPPLSLALWFDYGIATTTLATCGVPLPAGFTLSGVLGLGVPEHRTIGSGAIKINVETAGLSKFILTGTIDRIDFSRLIQLLAGMATRKIDIGSNIPSIQFHDLTLTVSPFGGEIFGVKYDAKVEAGAGINIGSFNAAGKFGLGLTPENPRLIIGAFLDPIEVKIPKCKICPEDGVLFAIGGFNIAKKEKALLRVDFQANQPLEKQLFKLYGALKVPPLQYLGKLNLNMEKNAFDGTGEGSFFGGKFTAKSTLHVNFNDPKDFEMSWLMHNDFTPYLCQKLKEGFITFKEQALEKINQYKETIQNARDNFANLSEVEKDRVAQHINELKLEIKKLNPKAVRKLKTATPGGSIIHISNHTDSQLYCAMYIVDKKSKISQRSGDIVSMAPHTKDQINRPSLMQIAKKDRDMFISTNSSDLKDTLTRDDYYAMTRQHVGSVFAKLHITQNEDNYVVYTGPEWAGQAGYEKITLGAELASYKAYQKAILKPGTKAAEKTMRAFQALNAVPEAFVKIAEQLVPVLDKSLQFVVVHDAQLSLAGKDLMKGKLPLVTLNFEMNIPKFKKIKVDIQDLQLDIKKPQSFIMDVVGIIAGQLVPQFISVEDKQELLEEAEADPDLTDLKEELAEIEL